MKEIKYKVGNLVLFKTYLSDKPIFGEIVKVEHLPRNLVVCDDWNDYYIVEKLKTLNGVDFQYGHLLILRKNILRLATKQELVAASL